MRISCYSLLGLLLSANMKNLEMTFCMLWQLIIWIVLDMWWSLKILAENISTCSCTEIGVYIILNMYSILVLWPYLCTKTVFMFVISPSAFTRVMKLYRLTITMTLWFSLKPRSHRACDRARFYKGCNEVADESQSQPVFWAWTKD